MHPINDQILDTPVTNGKYSVWCSFGSCLSVAAIRQMNTVENKVQPLMTYVFVCSIAHYPQDKMLCYIHVIVNACFTEQAGKFLLISWLPHSSEIYPLKHLGFNSEKARSLVVYYKLFTMLVSNDRYYDTRHHWIYHKTISSFKKKAPLWPRLF